MKNTSTVTLYHNPRCSKSREALALLEEKGLKPKVVEYLKTPPTLAELKKLQQMLGIPAREMLRKKETEYKALDLDNEALTDEQILMLVSKHPILIERPIVVYQDHAVIARPAETIQALFKK